jgi:hypothetical protein
MPPSSRRCAFHCDLAVPAPRLESALTLNHPTLKYERASIQDREPAGKS